MLTAISGTFTLEGFEYFNLFLRVRPHLAHHLILAMSRHLHSNRLVLLTENTHIMNEEHLQSDIRRILHILCNLSQ